LLVGDTEEELEVSFKNLICSVLNSIMLSHSLQEVHFPIHLGDWNPHV